MIKSLSYGSIAQKFIPVLLHKKLMLSSLLLHRNLTTAAPPVNYYKVLGLTPKATQTEIKAAYYKLTKIFHPDVNDDQSADAAEKFRQITSAYEVLGK